MDKKAELDEGASADAEEKLQAWETPILTKLHATDAELGLAAGADGVLQS